jgi:hypothetical protein
MTSLINQSNHYKAVIYYGETYNIGDIVKLNRDRVYDYLDLSNYSPTQEEWKLLNSFDKEFVIDDFCQVYTHPLTLDLCKFVGHDTWLDIKLLDKVNKKFEPAVCSECGTQYDWVNKTLGWVCNPCKTWRNNLGK